MKVDPINMKALETAVVAVTGSDTAMLIQTLYHLLHNAESDGFAEGYSFGAKEVNDAALRVTFNEAYAAGYDAASQYDEGYEDAWSSGYDMGFDRGYNEAELDNGIVASPTDFDGHDHSDTYMPQLYANCEALDKEMRRVYEASENVDEWYFPARERFVD